VTASGKGIKSDTKHILGSNDEHSVMTLEGTFLHHKKSFLKNQEELWHRISSSKNTQNTIGCLGHLLFPYPLIDNMMDSPVDDASSFVPQVLPVDLFVSLEFNGKIDLRRTTSQRHDMGSGFHGKGATMNGSGWRGIRDLFQGQHFDAVKTMVVRRT
jgi:hypothetical protein